MNFEQFQAARKLIDDVTKADRNCDVLQYGDTPDSGYEYPSGFYISKVGEHWPQAAREQGEFYLIIGNQEWLGDLADLERILFDAHRDELEDIQSSGEQG